MESSKVYHISPLHLRNLVIEKDTRDRDNAYTGLLPEQVNLTKEQKVTKYDTLYESIKREGFNEEFPIIIKLRRVNNEDKIFQGHHRLNIAIELELPTVPVRFIT